MLGFFSGGAVKKAALRFAHDSHLEGVYYR